VEVEREYIIQIYEMGADNVIVKPISVNSLIQKLALTLNPDNNWSKKVDECKTLIQMGKLSEAEKITEDFLKQKPDSAIALILKGDISRAKNNFREAEHYYTLASKKNKLYLEPLKKLVELYEQTNELKKKLESLKKLDRLSSLNHHRKIEIGHTHIQLNQEEEGKKYFDQAIKQVQKQATNMLCSAMMEIAQKLKNQRPDLSSQYIARAINTKGNNLSRKDLWMFNEMGVALRQQNRWEEAIEYYKKGLEIAPMDGGLLYNIGMAYAQGKKYYKALEYFKKALENTPEILNESPNIAFNIGKVYFKVNDFQEAQKFLSKAMELDPNFTEAKKLLQRISKR
jgi:tetratricopeptide (TPR) repeat protein